GPTKPIVPATTRNSGTASQKERATPTPTAAAVWTAEAQSGRGRRFGKNAEALPARRGGRSGGSRRSWPTPRDGPLATRILHAPCAGLTAWPRASGVRGVVRPLAPLPLCAP